MSSSGFYPTVLNYWEFLRKMTLCNLRQANTERPTRPGMHRTPKGLSKYTETRISYTIRFINQITQNESCHCRECGIYRWRINTIVASSPSYPDNPGNQSKPDR